jgi:hypothetical protein
VRRETTTSASADARAAHAGRFDLLRFDPDRMEWASASGGTLPTGRKPVDGGFEQGGGRLFHAYATVDGVQVPGKAGEHLVRESTLSVNWEADAHVCARAGSTSRSVAKSTS